VSFTKTLNNRPLQLLIILCRVCIPAVRSPYATDLQTEVEFLAENFLRPGTLLTSSIVKSSDLITRRKPHQRACLHEEQLFANS
jgi:hypothetical protein